MADKKHKKKFPVFSDRGTVFLETAFVLPIYFLLIAYCVDIPRLLAVKQRLSGANRLVAEIKARNKGVNNLVKAEDFHEWLFNKSKSIKVTIETRQDKGSKIKGIGEKVNKFCGKVIGALINIVTINTFKAYFQNICESDTFYSGYVTADTKTVLPTKAYRDFLQVKFGSGKEVPTIGSRYICYVPGADSAIEVEESFADKIKKYIPILF
jgi:hypothetical protein